MTAVAPASRPQDAFPWDPPLAWFDRPDWLTAGQKLTLVTDGQEAGRIAGYVAPWDGCLLDGKGSGCLSPPSSPTQYAGAMQGDTMTAEGVSVMTANIGGGVNHARYSESFAGAVKHYENTASQLARVRYGEDDYGIWFAGAVWPDVTDRDLRILRASAVSGDWRYRPELGAIDMTGVQLVNSPGFPLLRQHPGTSGRQMAAGLGEIGPGFVLLGGMGGPGTVDDDAPCCSACDLAERVSDLQAAVGELAAGGEPTVAALEAAFAAVAVQ